MATTTAEKPKAATTERAAPSGTALAAGAAAAGLALGLAANLFRKAVVQAPTALAGNWADALAAEHKATLAIFDKIQETGEAQTSKRAFLLMQLKHALAKHAMEEENAIYAALRDNGQVAEADHLNEDHGYVKQYLYDLTMLPKDSPSWSRKVGEFRSRIEAHMKEEEEVIFPRLRAALDEDGNKQLTVAMNKEGLKIA
ncbi:MAG: hemerythrin domain-containing protein [Sphingomonas fennica]